MRGRSSGKCKYVDFEDTLKSLSKISGREVKALTKKYEDPHDNMEVDVLSFMDDLKQVMG